MAAKTKTTRREKRGYKAYKERYRQARKRLKRKNKSMREKMLSLSEWKIYHERQKKRLEKRGIKNPNVNQYIVSNQSYNRSSKQWRTLKQNEERLLSDIGLDISKITEFGFRTGQYDSVLNEALSNEYWYLKEELGLTSSEAGAEISMLFFGSE